jgi:hypothetical protein
MENKYSPIERQDISNPDRNISHKDLLKKVNCINLVDNYTIEPLPNG